MNLLHRQDNNPFCRKLTKNGIFNQPHRLVMNTLNKGLSLRYGLLLGLLLWATVGMAQPNYRINNGKSRSNLAKALTGVWVKVRLDMADSSTLTGRNRALDSELIAAFDSVGIIRQIRPETDYKSRFVLQDSLLYIPNESEISKPWLTYKIEKLTPFELTFSEFDLNEAPHRRLRYTFARSDKKLSALLNETFVYPYMRASIEDTIFSMSQFVCPEFMGFLSFNDVYRNSFDYIENKFGFPPQRKGLFRFQFVVTKKGEINKIRINESSNPNYDERLKNAIRATRGRWQPALFEGKAVSTLIKYEFGYGEEYFSKGYVEASRQEEATSYYEQGVRAYSAKDYQRAVAMLSKAISLDDQNVQAYFSRGASYVELGQTDKACADWKYLVGLGQKWVERYVKQYCK